MIYVDSFPMSDLSVYPVPIELKGFLLTMKHPKVIFTHCICFPYLTHHSNYELHIQQCQPGSSHLYVVTIFQETISPL